MRAALKYVWGLTPRNYQRWMLVFIGLIVVLVGRWLWVSLTGDTQRWHNVVGVILIGPLAVPGFLLFLRFLQKRDDARIATGSTVNEDMDEEPSEHDVARHTSVIQPRSSWRQQIWQLFRRGGE